MPISAITSGSSGLPFSDELFKKLEEELNLSLGASMASSSNLPNVQQARTFSANGVTYKICNTAGYGSCGLHALLGKEIAGTYVCENAKPLFIAMLKRKNLHVINQRTIGFNIIDKSSENPPPDMSIDLWKLSKAVCMMFYEAEKHNIHQIYENQFRLINIDNQGASFLNFGASIDLKKRLIDGAKKATHIFFRDKLLLSAENPCPVIQVSPPPMSTGVFLRPMLPYFSGRTAYLETLKTEFATKDKVIRIGGFYGPSGLGKTETALAYAHTQKEEYALIFWLESETPESLYQSYKKLANYLSIECDERTSLEALQSNITRYLETALLEKPFLLIFDNLGQLPQFPQKGNGRILVTTKKCLDKHLALKPIQPFSEEEAVTVLAKILCSKSSPDFSILAKRLEYYPLAITQAAFYISRTPGMDVATYLKLLSQDEETFSKMALTDKRYPTPFAQTWKLTEKILQQKNPQALHWLRICAYLDPDAIPISWVQQWLEKSRQQDAFLKGNEILRILQEHGIIFADKQRKNFSIHRMQQLIIRLSFSSAAAKWAAIQETIDFVQYDYENPLDSSTVSLISQTRLLMQNILFWKKIIPMSLDTKIQLLTGMQKLANATIRLADNTLIKLITDYQKEQNKMTSKMIELLKIMSAELDKKELEANKESAELRKKQTEAEKKMAELEKTVSMLEKQKQETERKLQEGLKQQREAERKLQEFHKANSNSCRIL